MMNQSKTSKLIDDKISNILTSKNNQLLELEELWQFMDDVWDDFGCSNQEIDEKKISLFYNHPIWLLNGLFIEQHQVSMQHRYAIANWIEGQKRQISSVLDYGGGYGTLARLIAKKDQNTTIDIYEPHPSKIAVEKTKDHTNVKFIDSFNQQYDCLVSTDVLEHVPDPLALFAQMIAQVRTGGYLIIANCFYPVIKCHLPMTFHLRFTFNQFASMMGLQEVGDCMGSHATIYIKLKEEPLQWWRIRRFEVFSKAIFPLLDFAQIKYRKLRSLSSKLLLLK
jgi:2-polyprenyl-3-methyl-5-hydroxy-6-metoxy-1,4-benzoquinol methylase